MSEQKWRTVDFGRIVDSDNATIATCQSAEDARRIVACVNALADNEMAHLDGMMAIVTKTFDSNEWQLVPKKATDTMKKAAQDCHECDNGHIKYGAQYIYSAMLAAAPQPNLAQWQPIETAPKDGTVFLGMEGDRVFACRYSQDFANFITGFALGPTDAAKTFVLGVTPTLWLPLPQPPEQEK